MHVFYWLTFTGIKIKGIQVDKETIDIIKSNIKDKVVAEKFDFENALKNLVHKELPFIKISNIKIGEIDSFEIQFSIDI